MPAIIQKIDPIDYLVVKKHGYFSNEDSISNDYTSDVEGKKLADAYRKELLVLSEAEIDALVEAEHESERKEKQAKEAERENWRFYNQPCAKANYTVWCKMAYWSLAEATALFLEKNPKIASLLSMKDLPKDNAFAQQYNQTYELLRRAETSQQLDCYASPSEYVAWANTMDITLPNELVMLAQKYHPLDKTDGAVLD